MDACHIQNQVLRAEFVAKGAELRRLQVVGGPELLWNGDPEIWGRTAPLLFPIVGRVAGDQVRVDGKPYTLPQHGFARDLPFELMRLTREDCTWRLQDSPETRERYPFPFQLWVAFRLEGPLLQVRLELRNPGEKPLFASLGAHPAFRWPLGAAPRDTYRLEFEKPELAPIRRLARGLLDPNPYPTPVDGRILRLKDDHFRPDAMILDQVASRSVRFVAPGSLGLEVAWEGFPHLALWTIPGAGFLCIEPWAGYHSPEGFDGELAAKPGILRIDPGRGRAFAWSVRLLPPG